MGGSRFDFEWDKTNLSEGKKEFKRRRTREKLDKYNFCGTRRTYVGIVKIVG